MRRRIVLRLASRPSETAFRQQDRGGGAVLIFRYSISIDFATFDPSGTSADAGLQFL
jgi:hypothetical protein